MFSLEDFYSISLSETQAYKLIKYVALNLCGDKEVKWWNEVGHIINKDNSMLGSDWLTTVLDRVWWNLVTVDNYNDNFYSNANDEDKEKAGGPYVMTQKEIDKKREEFLMPNETIKKIKDYID